MVELLRRYANRTDVLADLNRAVDRLSRRSSELVPDQAPDDLASTGGKAHRVVVSRLSPEEVTAMVARFCAGATLRQVAAEHGIGLTSVKRLMREQGGRRKDQKPG